MSEQLIELQGVVRGKVQGVYFRATLSAHAQAIGITGHVKNCADGSVFFIAQGTRPQLEQFIERVRTQPGQAQIESINTEEMSIQTKCASFSITK